MWRRCEHLRAPISRPVLISSDANQTILIRRLLYLRAATTSHPRWLWQDGIHSDRGCISSLSVPLRRPQIVRFGADLAPPGRKMMLMEPPVPAIGVSGLFIT